MIQFTTRTGSVYRWDTDRNKMLRYEVGSESNPLMNDGLWETILGDVLLEVGQPAAFALDRPNKQFRITSDVVEIEDIG